MNDQIITAAVQLLLTSGIVAFLIKHYISKIDGMTDKVNTLVVDIAVIKRDLVSAINIRKDFQADHDKMVVLMERVERAFNDINAQHEKLRAQDFKLKEQDAKVEMIHRKYSGG